MALDIGRRRLEREVRAARREGRPTPAVVIVGAGLSGLAIAIQLVRSGLRDFTIVEQSDAVGGTWRDNTYPGSGCDVPSHLYSFSFSPKSDWSRRFAEQPEILSYAERCVERFRLGPHLRLGTTVQRADLDQAGRRWRLVLTSAGGEEEIEADDVIFACGQLNRPHVPDLPGLTGFAGPMWHSARWDHGCDLDGKLVAVVGSGASAIQFVPRVAERAAELTIYQRSPNYVAPKKDRTYGALARWMFDNIKVVERAYRWWIYWGLESRWIWFRKDGWAGRKLGQLFAKGIRREVVSERLPERTLVPDYPLGCKRILISSEWYPALMRPNVEVVDQPIGHIEADTIVTADGRRRPADVLIFGTGFSTTDFLAHIPIHGAGGRSLAGAWSDGAHAYLGTAVPGFPNCYLLYGPNTNLGHNSILFMVERQINLILQAMAVQVRSTETGAAPLVGVGVDAYQRDDQRTQHMLSATAWVAGCTSWYKNASGRVTNNWPSWTVRYWYDTLRLRPADLGIVGSTRRQPGAAPADGRGNGAVPHPPRLDPTEPSYEPM
ncbi:MAG: NAD(P)/FAD-dependent oxidoreductase [Acidimicrobiales bacterium]|jgi:cation diffusion facilitator CzcD-associated flavoprotein CzcO